MSASDHGIEAYWILFNGMCKRVWGESLDVCDPSDLLDYMRPAFGEAIGAIDDRREAVGTLLDLHEKLGSSGREAISTLFHASAWIDSMPALTDACEKAVEQAGVAVVDLLLVGLADDTAEEGAAELVFDTCRFAVHGLAAFDQKMRVLQTSYEGACRVADDTTVTDVLSAGRAIAAQQQEAPAVETLLDYYREAALEMAEDPWPLLEVLARISHTHRKAPASGGC